MIVSRVHTDGGSHIEPPLNQAWDDYTKLQWHAAVVAHDTGLTIRIHKQFRRGQYGVQIVGYSGAGSFDFRSAWVYISGVDAGAHTTTPKETS